jgi:hypothetical protein
MLAGYGAAYTVLATVRDAIVAELNTRSALPGRVGIVPGAIAWDECSGISDQCGQLALSCSRFFFTDQFPLEVTSTDQLQGSVLALDFTAQLIRCAPLPQDQSLSPSSSTLDASSQEVLNDMYTLVCAVPTALQSLWPANIVDFMLRQTIQVGPEGGCVGCELTFVVGISR